jgi:Tol biopolymer transport system component
MSISVVAQPAKRAMTFMDIIEMRSVSSPAVSPGANWVLYTMSTPDWKAGKSQTDIWLASIDGTVNKEMTLTRDKNEITPRWSRDGKYFVFASDRDASPSSSTPGAGAGEAAAGGRNQLYRMRPDGGEAEKITDAKDGVGAFAFSKDGKWLAFSAGKTEEQQIWIFSTSEIGLGKAKPLTKHPTSIRSWQFSPDSKDLFPFPGFCRQSR